MHCPWMCFFLRPHCLLLKIPLSWPKVGFSRHSAVARAHGWGLHASRAGQVARPPPSHVKYPGGKKNQSAQASPVDAGLLCFALLFSGMLKLALGYTLFLRKLIPCSWGCFLR